MELSKVFQRQTLRARLPENLRIYAIGDLHGRLDLLGAMLNEIERDIEARGPVRTQLVMLGDFIDRGPDSAKIARIFAAQSKWKNFVVLKGNHEAALVKGIRGDRRALDLWLDNGGDATLRSFGATDEEIFADHCRALPETIKRVIPKHIVDWMSRLPTTHQVGRYLFTHAGVRPGIPIKNQVERDLLWIRDEFVSSTADHGAIVVHGHTVFEDGVSIRSNRIGVDTGAYKTGRLSAIALEGDAQWVLEARDGQPRDLTARKSKPLPRLPRPLVQA